MWSFRKFKMLEQFWCGAFVNFNCRSSFGVELSQIYCVGAILAWSFRKLYLFEEFWCGAFVNSICLRNFDVELS